MDTEIEVDNRVRPHADQTKPVIPGLSSMWPDTLTARAGLPITYISPEVCALTEGDGAERSVRRTNGWWQSAVVRHRPLIGKHCKDVDVLALTLPETVGAQRSLVGEPCAACDRRRGCVLGPDRQEDTSCSAFEQPTGHQPDGASRKPSSARNCRQPVAELGDVGSRPVVDATHAHRLTRGRINHRKRNPRRITIDLE